MFFYLCSKPYDTDDVNPCTEHSQCGVIVPVSHCSHDIGKGVHEVIDVGIFGIDTVKGFLF